MTSYIWLGRLAWTMQVTLALVFSFTAWRKFNAHPIPVETVAALGMGQWLRVALGAAELAGAIGLLMPRLAWLAAACLALLMLGAAGTHLLVIGGSPAFAIGLMAASAVVACVRYKETLEAST